MGVTYRDLLTGANKWRCRSKDAYVMLLKHVSMSSSSMVRENYDYCGHYLSVFEMEDLLQSLVCLGCQSTSLEKWKLS